MKKENQRYEIQINYDEADFIDLNDGDITYIAEQICVDEFMENFKIEEDGMELFLTGTFKKEVLEKYDRVKDIIAEMENEFIVKVIKSRFE